MKRPYVHGFLLFQIDFPFILCYGLWKPWNDFTGYCCKKLKNTINYFPNAKTIDNPFLMLYSLQFPLYCVTIRPVANDDTSYP